MCTSGYFGGTCLIGLEVNITSTEIILALEAGQIKFTFLKVFMILGKEDTHILLNVCS